MKSYTKYILVLVGLITTGVSLYSIYKLGDFKKDGLTFLSGLTLLYGYLELDKLDRTKEEAKANKPDKKSSATK